MKFQTFPFVYPVLKALGMLFHYKAMLPSLALSFISHNILSEDMMEITFTSLSDLQFLLQ
jgi:hypothetical protein